MRMSGTLHGAKEAIAKLQGLKRSMARRIIRKGIRKAAQVGAKIAKPHTPVESKTLRNSMGWRVARMRPGIPKATGIVGARRRYERFVNGRKMVPANYAHLVDQGTAPHAITAKKKGLFFRVGGRSVFVKSARHPGSRPQKFMQRALGSARGPMLHDFTRTVTNELALQAAKAKPSEVDDG